MRKWVRPSHRGREYRLCWIYSMRAWQTRWKSFAITQTPVRITSQKKKVQLCCLPFFFNSCYDSLSRTLGNGLTYFFPPFVVRNVDYIRNKKKTRLMLAEGNGEKSWYASATIDPSLWCSLLLFIKTAVRAVAVLGWRFISTITGRTSDYIITESLLYSIYASRIIAMNNISNCFETSPRLYPWSALRTMIVIG